ncbi:aminomethyltransferase, mitochondrial-like [Halichondria panicea]|uniref:aminomethyltransferase, mitochondrial-like n=1 Tax=Halichondria panicea TaxID=6063 RepID=UPI00312B5C9D
MVTVGILRNWRLVRRFRQAPFLLQSLRTSSSNVELFKTALHEYHVSNGGKMVPYAGWSMPMAYELSITDSALHTRNSVSLFDVSHMLQMEVSGADSREFLETVSPIDLQRLNDGSGALSVFTNDKGGIIDDCIITRTGPQSFYVVANAGCADKDMQHLNDQIQRKFSGRDVKLVAREDMSLIALQGPKMQHVLSQGLKDDIKKLHFMESAVMEVFGVPKCRVTRCGYTGEDGVEISVPSCEVNTLVSKLSKFSEVKLAGLGSRDILRLEAGLCLYGNDISEDITPIEAGLAWCISQRRRKMGDFIGSDVIQRQLKDKPKNRRVGLISKSKRPIRQGVIVQDMDGNNIGHVTSGGPSPKLEAYVAMAYVPRTLGKQGTKLKLQIRNASLRAEVVKLPFVPAQYYVQ